MTESVQRAHTQLSRVLRVIRKLRDLPHGRRVAHRALEVRLLRLLEGPDPSAVRAASLALRELCRSPPVTRRLLTLLAREGPTREGAAIVLAARDQHAQRILRALAGQPRPVGDVTIQRVIDALDPRWERVPCDRELHPTTVSCVAIDRRTERLASASHAGDVRVWQGPSLRLEAVFRERGRRSHVDALAFDARGERLAIVADGVAAIVSLSSYQTERTKRLSCRGWAAASVSGVLAQGRSELTLLDWRLEPVRTLRPRRYLEILAVDEQLELLAVRDWDHKRWGVRDLRTGKMLWTTTFAEDSQQRFGFLPGQRLAVSERNRLFVLDAQRGHRLQTLRWPGSTTPRDALIGMEDFVLSNRGVMSLSTGQLFPLERGDGTHVRPQQTLCVLHHYEWAQLLYADATRTRWIEERKRLVHCDRTRRGSVQIATHTKPRCAILLEEGDARRGELRSFDGGEPIALIGGRTGRLGHLLFSPNGNLLAGAKSGEVLVWDVSGPTPILIPPLPMDGWSWPLAFSPDSSRLVIADQSRTLKLLCTKTWKVIDRWGLRRDSASAAAFSRDGSMLAVGTSYDPVIEVFDVETGAARDLYEGHQAPCTDLSALPRSGRFVSQSRDGAIHVWQVQAHSS